MVKYSQKQKTNISVVRKKYLKILIAILTLILIISSLAYTNFLSINIDQKKQVVKETSQSNPPDLLQVFFDAAKTAYVDGYNLEEVNCTTYNLDGFYYDIYKNIQKDTIIDTIIDTIKYKPQPEKKISNKIKSINQKLNNSNSDSNFLTIVVGFSKCDINDEITYYYDTMNSPQVGSQTYFYLDSLDDEFGIQLKSNHFCVAPNYVKDNTLYFSCRNGHASWWSKALLSKEIDNNTLKVEFNCEESTDYEREEKYQYACWF